MQLTQEKFEKILDKKLTHFPTKDDLQNAVSGSEKRIIKRIDEAQEELAVMTKNGFDDVLERLDVRERVSKLEKDFAVMKSALHLS